MDYRLKVISKRVELPEDVTAVCQRRHCADSIDKQNITRPMLQDRVIVSYDPHAKN